MPNEFSSTTNSPGLLKNVYDTGDSPLGAALKKKRKSLLDTSKDKTDATPDDKDED